MPEPVPEQAGWGCLLAGLGVALKDALLLTVGCALVALGINAWIHPHSIPLFAEEAYETLVPCPEPGGEIVLLAADQPDLLGSGTFVIDARPAADFQRWHAPGAINVTYDYLDPTPQEVIHQVARSIASSRSRRLVVYGDGDDPDSGVQLAKEISGKGIKNVHAVRGGAPALQKAGQTGGQR